MVKHIEHLEDLIFSKSKEETFTIVTALIQHVYLGPRLARGRLSIKLDGRPSIVFGIDKKVFVSTKSFFNKESIYYTNKEEMQKITDLELRKKMEYYLEYFEKNFRGYSGQWFQADVLKDPFNEGATNVIEYKFNSVLDEQEFVYSVVDSNDHLSVLNYGNFKPCDYYVLTPNFGAFKAHLAHSIEYDFKYYTNPPKTKKKITEFKKEVNSNIRNMTYVWSEEIKPYLIGFEKLNVLKKILMDELNSSFYRTHECFYNGEKCNDEGYVFEYGDTMVKLVDRYEFSKRNFDKNDL